MGEPRVEQPGGLIYYLEMHQLIQWGKYTELEEFGGFVPKDGNSGSSTSIAGTTGEQQMTQLGAIMGGWNKV